MIDLPDLRRVLANHPRALGRYESVRAALLRLMPVPDYSKMAMPHDLRAGVPRARFRRPGSQVDGWLSHNEEAALYLLARTSPGAVLEIGAWVGRSTICLANGLRDGRNRAKLTTCELNPTVANFREVSPGFVGFFYPPDHSVPMGEPVTVECYSHRIRPMIEMPGGLVGQLRRNLAAAGCSETVEIHVGDFRTLPPMSFALLFTDAMHDPGEIARNAPDLSPYMTKGSLLACHDSNPWNCETLRRYFSFSEDCLVDSLFVGRVEKVLQPAGQPPCG